MHGELSLAALKAAHWEEDAALACKLVGGAGLKDSAWNNSSKAPGDFRRSFLFSQSLFKTVKDESESKRQGRPPLT